MHCEVEAPFFSVLPIIYDFYSTLLNYQIMQCKKYPLTDILEKHFFLIFYVRLSG